MIISSYIKNLSPQKDGRTYVTEIQVDDVLGKQEYLYLAEVGADIEQIRIDRSKAINEFMAEQPLTTDEIKAKISELLSQLPEEERVAVLEEASLSEQVTTK